MCEYQSNSLARVTLALRLPHVLAGFVELKKQHSTFTFIPRSSSRKQGSGSHFRFLFGLVVNKIAIYLFTDKLSCKLLWLGMCMNFVGSAFFESNVAQYSEILHTIYLTVFPRTYLQNLACHL